MNQKLKSYLSVFIVFVFSIVLAIILASLGGQLHRLFWKYEGCWFWGHCDAGATTLGFCYFYIFFLTFMAFLFLTKKKAWIVFAIGSSLLWFLAISFIYIDLRSTNIYEDIGSLIIMICMFAIGWLLAQGGLIIYKKLKNKL